MKKDELILAGAAFFVAMLWLKARKTSAPTVTSGAGGPPAWTQMPGPMGAKWDPMTGTVQMAPLYA